MCQNYGRIVVRKHPEDDHHADCRPVSSALFDVVDMDRQMRSEVKTTGKKTKISLCGYHLGHPPKKSSLRPNKQLSPLTFLHSTPSMDNCIDHRDAACTPVPDAGIIPDGRMHVFYADIEFVSYIRVSMSSATERTR